MLLNSARRTGAPAAGLPAWFTTATWTRVPIDETQSPARIPASSLAGHTLIELDTVCASPLGSRYSISALTVIGLFAAGILVISVRAPPLASSTSATF